MSVRVMSAFWEIPMQPLDKLVLLALADAANDQGYCWPSVATIARKSGVCERSVQRAIRRAESCGMVKREEVKGKGCKYHLIPRHTVTPDTQSPATDSPATPDTQSPKPLRTTNPTPVSSDEETAPAVRDVHVLEAYNAMAGRAGLPKAKMTDERRRKLKPFLRRHTVDDITEAISAIERSSFCRGENDRGWRADFDFLLQPKSFTRLIEGFYDR